MKTIGIAAITAEGAANCYKAIVSLSSQKLGVNHHPEVLLDSPPFYTILEAQNRGDWKTVAAILTTAVDKLAQAGAEVAIMPANSVHFAYDNIVATTSIPILSIVELTAAECARLQYRKVAVLGVGLIMSGGLYDAPLRTVNVESVALTPAEQSALNAIIYEELVQGRVVEESVATIVNLCIQLKRRGAEALVLACTELGMAITVNNSPLPFIDTTHLLAQKAVEYSLA